MSHQRMARSVVAPPMTASVIAAPTCAQPAQRCPDAAGRAGRAAAGDGRPEARGGDPGESCGPRVGRGQSSPEHFRIDQGALAGRPHAWVAGRDLVRSVDGRPSRCGDRRGHRPPSRPPDAARRWPRGSPSSCAARACREPRRPARPASRPRAPAARRDREGQRRREPDPQRRERTGSHTDHDVGDVTDPQTGGRQRVSQHRGEQLAVPTRADLGGLGQDRASRRGRPP